VIYEWCEGGMSPGTCFLPSDHRWAKSYQGPGDTGNGRRQKQVKLAKKCRKSGSDRGACAKRRSYLYTPPGKSAFDLPGHVRIELSRILMEIRAVDGSKSHVLQWHQRFLCRARRPERIAAGNL